MASRMAATSPKRSAKEPQECPERAQRESRRRPALPRNRSNRLPDVSCQKYWPPCFTTYMLTHVPPPGISPKH
eukprot:1218025-Pyramimonas_sp.AAC.1